MEKTNRVKNMGILIVAFISLVYNALRFLGEEKSVMPIPNSLFNMIFCLFIILLSLFKNELTMERKYYQEKLEKYFKKFK